MSTFDHAAFTAAREAAGLSRDHAASWVGISVSTLQSYERGWREPRFDVVARLARLYGVALEVFAHEHDATPASPGRAEKHDSPDPRPLAGDVERAGATGG